MIWKDFTYKGQLISTATVDFRVWLSVVQWKTLDVSDEQSNVQGYHGIKLSPTFVRGRRITLEGIIIADDHVWSSKAIDYLETLFALQGVPSVVEMSPFTVTDEQDRIWRIEAKIKEPVSIEIPDDDFLQWSSRRWRVVLQSEDPRYFSQIEATVTWSEWNFWGVKFPVKFGVPFNEEYNEIQVITTGTIETPIKIQLDILWQVQSPLSIKNITNNTFFNLDINAIPWDVIIVNSKTRTATKNWLNILAQRLLWSTRPKIKNTTMYQIHDQEGWLLESDFDVIITFNDVLL